MNAGAIVIRRQNQYTNRFIQSGAVNAEHSVLPEAIGVPTNFIFIRMRNRGIFLPCENGTYYLDVKAWAFFREARRKRALMILFLILILYLFFYYTGIR